MEQISAMANNTSNWVGPGIPWSLRGGFILVPLVHSAGMNIVTLLAFRFLTDNLAISAALAGIMFAFVKVYDGLLDPVLGTLSDRTRGRWGRRLPFLLVGALLMPLAVIAIFNPPNFSSLLALQTFIVVALMLHASAYTALTIPGMAMLVEASSDYHRRSTLMSYRVLGNSIGVLFGSTIPAWLLSRWGPTRGGHGRMALVIAGVLIVAGVMAVLLLRNAPRTQPTRIEAQTFADRFRLAWTNKPFRILALTHIFVLIGTAITSIGNAYFNKYVLRLGDGWLGTYYMIATVGSVASMPLWLKFGKAYGKKSGYMVSMAGFGVMHLSWLLVGANEPYGLLVARAVLTGFFSGGVILFAYSMLSDAMRYDYISSGLRREGAFAGITSLIDKLAAALGIAGIGFFLSGTGYVASTAAAAAVQPPSAITAIYLTFTVVPGFAMLLAMATLRAYQLDERALQESNEVVDNTPASG